MVKHILARSDRRGSSLSIGGAETSTQNCADPAAILAIEDKSPNTVELQEVESNVLSKASAINLVKTSLASHDFHILH